MARNRSTLPDGWPILNFALFAKFRVGMFISPQLCHPDPLIEGDPQCGPEMRTVKRAGGPQVTLVISARSILAYPD